MVLKVCHICSSSEATEYKRGSKYPHYSLEEISGMFYFVFYLLAVRHSANAVLRNKPGYILS